MLESSELRGHVLYSLDAATDFPCYNRDIFLAVGGRFHLSCKVSRVGGRMVPGKFETVRVFMHQKIFHNHEEK